MELKEFKDLISPIVMWLSWSLTYVFNKTRKGEKMTLSQHLLHIFISGFIGSLSYLWCDYFWITGSLVWIITWISAYSWVTIIDSFDKAKDWMADSLISKVKNRIWK